MSNLSKILIFILLLVTIIGGAMVPFAAEFILPFFFPPERIVGAQVWNQFISIILGVAATIMSVVSLIISYHSENQALQTEIRTKDLLNEIKIALVKVSLKQDQMQKSIDGYSISSNTLSSNLTGGKKGNDDEEVN